MKILLAYYSGTGHTAYLSGLIQKELRKNEDEVILFPIDGKGTQPELFSYDLIGLGYPIHGFNEPRLFRKFVKALRLRPRARVFLYKCSGEVLHLNNASSDFTKKVLKKKGAMLVGEYHFVTPYNIRFRTPDSFVKQALIYDRKQVEVLAHDLEEGTIRTLKPNLWDKVVSRLCLIEHKAGFVNSFFMRVDPKKCTSCGLCASLCPVQNITLKKGKVVFLHHCETCMNCAFRCPQNAIKMGFLNGWKVNGPYDIEAIMEDPSIQPNFVKAGAKGFYACFPAYFANIQKQWSQLPWNSHN